MRNDAATEHPRLRNAVLKHSVPMGAEAAGPMEYSPAGVAESFFEAIDQTSGSGLSNRTQAQHFWKIRTRSLAWIRDRRDVGNHYSTIFLESAQQQLRLKPFS